MTRRTALLLFLAERIVDNAIERAQISAVPNAPPVGEVGVTAMKQPRKNKPGAGRSEKFDTRAAAFAALCLLKFHFGEETRARPGSRLRAARAAIRWYMTLATPDTGSVLEYRVDAQVVAVKKQLQRLESGETTLHQHVVLALAADRSPDLTDEVSLLETAQYIAREVAKFLPQ